MASRKGQPAATHLGEKRLEMLHGQRKRADTSSDIPGKQMNRNATWPAEKGSQQRHTWETNEYKCYMVNGKGQKPATDLGDKRIEYKCYMASGKGRTPPVTDLGDKRLEMLHGQRKRADTSSDIPGKQMNRNATWPAEKGSQQRHTWETNEYKCYMVNGKGQKPATDLGDKRIEYKCYMASGKGRTPPVTDLGDKRLEMLHGQRKRADTSSDIPGKQMNRNATWPAEKGGHHQRQTSETKD